MSFITPVRMLAVCWGITLLVLIAFTDNFSNTILGPDTTATSAVFNQSDF